MGQYLSKASAHGKAVFLLYELQKGMSLEDLRGLFEELAVSDAERRGLAEGMEEVLRQHRYPPAEIWKLMEEVYPERVTTAGTASPSAPTEVKAPAADTTVGEAEKATRKRVGKRTQPVKSPFLKPFEGEFDAVEGAAPPEISHPAEDTAVKEVRPVSQPTAPAQQAPGQQAPTQQTPTQQTPTQQTPTQPTSKQEAPATGRSLRDIDKTGMFGATLKGLDVDAVRPRTKARVLVADDDQRIRLIYRTKLEESGYTVIEAENGMEAWRLVSTGEADVAVLDMKMPGYHGLDVLSRMSDAGMDMPVIISTAYDQLSDEFVVATYPRLKYLVKPVDPNDLVAAIEEFVQQAGG